MQQPHSNTEKRPYHTPNLVTVGSIADVVQNVLGPGPEDILGTGFTDPPPGVS